MEVCTIQQYSFDQIQQIASNFTATLDPEVIELLLEIKKNNRFIRRKSPVKMTYVIADSWRVSGKDSVELSDDVKFQNTVTSNLNKLTSQNMDTIRDEILKLFESLPGEGTDKFIDLVFEKAMEEKFYSDDYAQLVGKLFQSCDLLDKAHLLSKCRAFYDEKISTNVEQLKQSKDGDYNKLCEVFARKAEFIGGFVFISNLFNYDIVDYELVKKYFDGLKEYALSVPKEDSGIYIDCIVSILKNCGKKLEEFNKEEFNNNFLNICSTLISDKSRIQAKHRFKLVDIKELHVNNWVSDSSWSKA
ncbi:MIF4G domain-containing protein [bacterium]|nr:MIF4G domain-containing protein [bacterium]